MKLCPFLSLMLASNVILLLIDANGSTAKGVPHITIIQVVFQL